MRIIVIITILILTLTNTKNIYAQSSTINTQTNIVVPSTNVIDILLWQSLFGVGGTYLGALCGILISNGIQDLLHDTQPFPWYRDVLGYSMLLVGVSLGVTLISSLNNYNGSFWSSMLGASAGLFVFGVIALPMRNNSQMFPSIVYNIVTGILFFAPAVGAIIGYDLSIPISKNTGIININNNKLCIYMPAINIYYDKYEIQLFNISY